MVSTRTDNRVKKRAILKEIIEDFLTVYAQSDNSLEKLGMVKMQTLKLDSANMLKTVRALHRETIDSYIYANGHDGTTAPTETNVFFTIKKGGGYAEKQTN